MEKRSNLLYALYLLALTLTIVLFQNCSKVAVSDLPVDSQGSALGDPNGGGTGTGTPTCQTQLIDTLQTVKVLFLVDTSGSNAENPGTDIGKVWRLQTLNNFISRYGSKSNFYYGLATFQGTAATPQITSGGKAVFTNDLNVVKEGISKFTATPDQDSTPYKPALRLAHDLIASDIAAHPPKDTVYAVVMISDGGAKDYTYASQMAPDVDSVMAVSPSQIRLNSVFYYGAVKDLTQVSFLQLIAQIGKGSFITANANESLQIDDVIKVPQLNCQ